MLLMTYELGPQHWVCWPRGREDWVAHGNTMYEAVGRLIVDKAPWHPTVEIKMGDKYDVLIELIRRT